LLGEVDVFQIDSTHEVYAHMNVDYVRTPDLPKYPEYGSLLQALARDEYFISTGEVLLRDAISISGPPDQIVVRARLSYTFPLNLAEVV